MKHPVRIVRGRGEGKRIGFPTFNFEVPLNIEDASGIYAGFVHFGGTKHPAVFHFGPIPTFNINETVLEAHLLQDFEGIPETAEIELVEFIRKIEHFENLEELKTAIAGDVAKAKKMLDIL